MSWALSKIREHSFGRGRTRIHTDEEASLIFIRVNPCPSVAKFVSVKMGSARFRGAFKITGEIRSPAALRTRGLAQLNFPSREILPKRLREFAVYSRRKLTSIVASTVTGVPSLIMPGVKRHCLTASIAF